MKKLWLLCLLGALITSCDNNEQSWDELIQNDTYVFQSINYTLEEGDGIEEIKSPQPVVHVKNETSSIRKFKHFHTGNITETSLFTTNDHSLYKRLDSAGKINIPKDISESNTVIVDFPKANYIENREELLIKTQQQSSMVDMPPGSKLEIKDTLCFNKLQVTYEATFIGQETSYTIKVKGKWSGQVFKKFETDLPLSPIN